MGTPTPEPPDYAPELLPTPDGGLIFGTPEITPTSAPELPSAPIVGPAGSVAPNTQIWIVNLDDSNVSPVETTATATGGFSAVVRGGDGDRIRIVAREPRRHSLPLDARIVATGAGSLRAADAAPEALSCLTLRPAQEVAVQVDEGQTTTRSIVLDNRCDTTVTIEHAALRFGDQRFELATPASSVPVNESASLTLSIRGHADDDEHADILLLDVVSSGKRGRYALGVWSISSDGTGND